MTEMRGEMRGWRATRRSDVRRGERTRAGLRQGVLGLTLAALALLAIAARAEEPPRPSPLAGHGVRDNVAPYTAEELTELEELAERVKEFEARAAEYREATRKLIEHKYQQKRGTLFDSYEEIIVDLESEQRRLRDDAIAKFEVFLRSYPDAPRYTPDSMFRLAELYFERSYDVYFQARQGFDKAMEKWSPDSNEPEPIEPQFHYEPTIAMMQRLITEFPEYRLVDGAYYLLGYCLTEQGEEDRAVVVYEELVGRYPQSRFGAEVWTRIGEYYFNANELERALAAYTKVLDEVDSPFYDKAMYKLAWTHYRLADPERAPHEFQAAIDAFIRLLDFNQKTKEEGKERGGDLRGESIQYIAISYADETWGGLDKLLAQLQSIGGRPYDRELVKALGDVYFDQTRFADAVRAYETVQARFPDHPHAPEVQDKIITALERDRNFDAAAKKREELTARYSEGSAWYEANKGDEDVLRVAAKLTEGALYSAALFHHRQAQIHREAQKFELATQEYGKAAEAYGKYLERFPHDKQLYELTFYHAETLYYSLQFLAAAQRYEKVRDSNADDKLLKDAAFSAVLSYERAVQVGESTGEIPQAVVLKSTDRDPDQAIVAREIPPLKLKIIEASDRYASAVPNDEQVPKVLYKAAELFYIYDDFPEARRRFESLLEAYPQHEVAEFASNLIIESHLAEKNFAAVEQFSRQLLTRAAVPGRKEFKGELVTFKTGAMFKIAEDLAAKGEHEQAAELYLKLLEENPATQFADSALNNAAVAYEKVQRYDSASKLYERMVREHPKSPLADNALFRVGINAERFFDFEKAIQAYLKLVDGYPKSDRRADAIYNAALSLENTQSYERAAQQYLRYCELFPKRDDAPQVCFRAGSVYEKMGAPQKVVSTYQSFIKRYRSNTQHADRVAEAHLKIAKAYEHLKKDKEARKYYEATVKEVKRAGNEKAALYAAEAQFQLVERDFARFRAVAVTGSTKEQKKAIGRKAQLLKDVETSYKEILKFKHVDWTMASLYRIGQLYQNFAESIISAPCPPEIKKTARQMDMTVEEVCDEYRILLEEQAANVEDKAVAAYETTINRARELQVVNKWTKLTLVALNKLRRSAWPLQKDAKIFVDQAAVATPPLVEPDGAVLRTDQPPAAAPTAAAPEQAAPTGAAQ